MKRLIWIVLAVAIVPLSGLAWIGPAAAAPAPAALTYLAPPDGGRFVQPTATLGLRLDGPIDPASLSAALFSVTGAASGPHAGQARLADDGATVVFIPAAPFARGEQVTLAVGPGLRTRAGGVFAGVQTTFSVSPGGAPLDLRALLAEDEGTASAGPSAPAAPGAVTAHPQDYVTFPDDFPAYTVTVPASNTAPGLLFTAPFRRAAPTGNYLLISDDSGEPVYYQYTGDNALDFKVQPDGTLSYHASADLNYHVLDNTYKETRVISMTGNLDTDGHELRILPNGHALFMAYDPEPATPDEIAAGVAPTATVIGLQIQEQDISGLTTFSWASWDHFAITDTYVSLTTPQVDYVHGNALEVDNDGNLLLSSRHMSEITKIDYQNGLGTGAMIWRLGGKNNQFSITDPGGPFAFQHHIRRIDNGDLTLFDNHNDTVSHTDGSRAVEYQIDETNKVLTNTWQFQDTPPIQGFAMGDVQRLPDGHTFIGWGFGHPSVTEVLTDGTKVFEMDFAPDVQSYRAFRLPWSAVPYWPATLVVTGTAPATLYYSWNGATDVDHYEIYGGYGLTPGTLLGTQPRTGFEDHTALVSVPSGFCAFRVRPVNHADQPQGFSNVVYTQTPCGVSWLPVIFGPLAN